jgi:hypothetical protein
MTATFRADPTTLTFPANANVFNPAIHAMQVHRP